MKPSKKPMSFSYRPPSIRAQPGFVDVYIPFMRCLVESGYTDKANIYNFATQYFENKVKDAQERIKRDQKRNITKRDISIILGIEPDFTYDSTLEQFPGTYGSEQSENSEKEDLIKHVRLAVKASEKQNKTESEKDNPVPRDDLLEVMTVNSQLLPEYIKALEAFIASCQDKNIASDNYGKSQEVERDSATEKAEVNCQDEGKKSRTLSEEDPSLTSEQIILHHVRNLERASKCLLQLNNFAIQKCFGNGLGCRDKPENTKLKDADLRSFKRKLTENLRDTTDPEKYEERDTFSRTHQNTISGRTIEESGNEKHPMFLDKLYKNGNFAVVQSEHEEPKIILGQSFTELIGNILQDGKEDGTSATKNLESLKKTSSPEELFIMKKEIKVKGKAESFKNAIEKPTRVETPTNFLEPGTELSLCGVNGRGSDSSNTTSSSDETDNLSSVETNVPSPETTDSLSLDEEDESQFFLNPPSPENSSSLNSSCSVKERLLQNPLPYTFNEFVSCAENAPEFSLNGHFQFPESERETCICGNNKPLTSLDCTVLPISGSSWLRTYLTVKMIRQVEKAGNMDDPQVVVIGNRTTILKKCDKGSRFKYSLQLQSLFGAVRAWYFTRKFREFQKESST